MFSKIKRIYNEIVNSQVMADCGHKTILKDKLFLFKPNDPTNQRGEAYITLHVHDDGSVKLCHSCVQDAIIRCIHCGGSILPYQRINLTPVKEFTSTIPIYAKKWRINENSQAWYIGCNNTEECCRHIDENCLNIWTIYQDVHRTTFPI